MRTLSTTQHNIKQISELEKDDLARRAYSEACRSAFRSDVDQRSELMPISIPN
jgi:hypothetical protein